jgi:hypothetical protein
MSFLAGRQRFFKLSRLVWWMCVHPFLWLPFGFNIHKWNPGFITKVLKIMERRLSQNVCSTLGTSSSLTAAGRPLHSSSWTFVCPPIFEDSTPLSYSSFTQYISVVNRACICNPRWISTVLKILAWRKRITAWMSQLAGFSAAEHIITHSVKARTNTRWPVMLLFRRQWVMSRYVACAHTLVALKK